MKTRVLLFQPYLRVHILNFGQALKRFTYVLEQPPTFASSKAFYMRGTGSSANAEFTRNKVTFVIRMRRILGILNVRPKFTNQADLLFTYGCLLLTNKPYCVYIENGAALFNYDATIARNPIARLLFALLVRLPQCRKLIFMSQTAHQSLLATTCPSRATRQIIERKAVQIYPFVRDPGDVTPKQLGKTLRLLFTGVFYMKGGIETLNAYQVLRRQYRNLSLTVITPLHHLRPRDRRHLERTPGVSLHDAAFSKEEMAAIYRRHDVFLFPTFRDTFGLVLIEALSFGLPIVGINQYAVQEMVETGYNGFLYGENPIADYNPRTYEMYGRLYNAKDFYVALFAAQTAGRMKPVEAFLVTSIQRYLDDPALLTRHSRHALELYRKKFSERVIRRKIEGAFTAALNRA